MVERIILMEHENVFLFEYGIIVPAVLKCLFRHNLCRRRLCSHCTGYWNGASQKVYRIGLLFTLGMLLSKHFLLRNSTAPLRCWKWNAPYRIGFWNGPNQVWTIFSEQKLQRNLVLVNDLFKLKWSVENCITDRASIQTGNASEQFLHRNRILIPVHTVPEQLLKRSKNLSGTVWI